MIIDFNKNNGGGGDMSNYYTKSEVDVKVSQLEGEISASTEGFYTSAQTETAIAEATENFVTSAETEQQIEELVGADLIDFEGTVQQALESAGIYNDEDGVLNVVTMINDVVDTFSGITSGLTAELSTVERVTSAAINSLQQEVINVQNDIPDVSNFVTSGEVQTQIDDAIDAIDLSAYYTSAQTETAITSKGYITSADTTNFVSKTELLEKEEVISTALNELNDTKVASNFGSGHTVTAIWQGSQDDYNMLTQSGATANPTTFYIITGTTS